MEKTQTFQTIISLNTQEAKNEIADLEKRLEVLKKKKADALRDPGTLVKDINKFDKEIKAAEASLKAYGNNVSKTIETINNLETASLGDIEKAAREVRRAMKQATTVEEYNKLNRYLQDCKDRMDELKASSIQSKKELQALDQAADNLKNVLGNINGASLNELTAAAASLQQKLGDIKPDDTAYHETAENLSKIKNRIQQLSASQKEANLTIDKYDEEIKAACKSSQDLERENKLINETLKNISGSSLRDLQYSLKIVNERLADQKQGTAAFEDLTDHAKKLKAQIAAINGEQEKSASLFGKTANFLNKNWGAITQTIAAFSGLSANVRQCVDAYTEMDQEMNNVRKYTGQSMEEVMEMNEDFKKIDTRTPRKHLNELAESAGRLGITSKDSIEEFVDAADKISVALGDDLGDDAIDKVGKLAMAFGEDDRLGLRGAMLATGSAINELAQNSSASAGYLVEFTARVAGVGKQVGLTQAQIMGFGAVMDENMQKDEMASTAFSQLLTKMSTDTKTFAKMAGVDLKTFSNLVKTDINTAVLTLMDNLKSKGGFDQLGKMFGDMGLDGTRAVAVLSTMADKIDDVRSRQEIATNAYKEATSVIEEFDVQNTTIQGDIEKAKNRFHELAIELGEKLLPVVKYSISTGGIAIKLLSVATSFTLKYWRVIVVLASGIVAYTLVVKAEAIAEKAATAAKMASAAADKLKAVRTAFAASAQEAYNIAVKVGTRQITLATAAQQLWNKAILANPYSAILATMVAVTATLVAFTSKADKATKAQRELNEANAEAAADCRSEVAELSSLVKLAQDKSSSDEVRKEAIKKLQEKYPGYLDNLNLENIYSNNARKAVDNLTDSILAQAKARVYLSKVEELEREKQNVNEEYLNDWWGKMSHTFTSQFQALANNIAHYAEKGYNAVSQGVGNWQFNRGLKGFKEGWNEKTYIEREGYGLNIAQQYNRNHQAELNDLSRMQNVYLEKYREVQKQEAENLKNVRKANKDLGSQGDQSTSNNSEEYESEAERKKREQEERKAAIATRKAEAERKRKEAQALLKKKTELEKQYQQDMLKMDNEEIQRKHANIAIDLQMAYEKKGAQEELFKGENALKEELYHNEDALNEAMYQNDINMLKSRQSLYKKDSQEWLDIDTEIKQRQKEQELTREQRYNDLLAQYRAEWGRKDIKEQEDIALKGLESLHSKKLLKEEEYEEMKKKIRLHYAELESSENLKNSAGEQFKQNVQSAYNTASNNAQADYSDKHPNGLNVGNLLTSDIDIYKSTLDNIKSMETESVISHQEAMAAMSEATANMCNNLVTKMQAAMDTVSPLLSGMSSYYAAQSDYEVTVTEKKYEKLINAAGNNTAKTKKLEEKKEKEVAKIKSKYARKQVAMQIAQAIAQTALSAIAAYSSAMQGVPYPANLILAPVAAGIAAAAGAIQIATIKKQQQAQEAGYYEGGFTSGKRYRREAGVVHEGEFVANHNAVNNPSILPALQLIDQAQRNNTVSTLTAADISRSIGQGGATVVSAPSVTVQTDNEDLKNTIDDTNIVIDNLRDLLAAGVHAKLSMAELDREWKHYQRLQSNK